MRASKKIADVEVLRNNFYTSVVGFMCFPGKVLGEVRVDEFLQQESVHFIRQLHQRKGRQWILRA